MTTATAADDRLISTGEAARLTGLAQHRVQRWADRLGLVVTAVGGGGKYGARIIREGDLPKITEAAARGRWPKKD